MNTIRWNDRIRAWLSPHGLAERLIQERLDGDARPDEETRDREVWLDNHLESCARCRRSWTSKSALKSALSALPSVAASDGFVSDVLEAVAQNEPALPRTSTFMTPQWGWGLGLSSAVMAAVALVVTLNARVDGTRSTGKEIAVSAAGGPLRVAERVHFRVRVVGLTAAEARSRVTSLILPAGEIFKDTDEALYVRFGRAELVPMMRKLATQGRYKVSKVADLTKDATAVVIRFDLAY